MTYHCAHGNFFVGIADFAETGNSIEINQAFRLEQPELEHRHDALPTAKVLASRCALNSLRASSKRLGAK